MKIIAIGGGGFTHDTHPELDDFFLSHVQGGEPRIGYIGAANGDQPERIERFHSRFRGFAKTSHLPSTAPLVEMKKWVENQAAIYVGGGNTKHLMNEWRTSGMDDLLASAAQRGVVLAGVSAGAVCWFETAFSNYDGKQFLPVGGLGLIGGSCTPHYSTEPDRPPAFSSAIAKGDISNGIAIDDGVAVVYESRRSLMAFSAVAGAGAYAVKRTRVGVSSDPLPLIH